MSANSERMLVSDIPGTTRDAVDIVLRRRDRTYTLIDTAGIRRRGKVRGKLEKFSIIRALAALERCDLALLIIDAGEGITEQDTKVIGYTQDSGRACILVINKWDLVSGDRKRQKGVLTEVEMATPFVGFAPVLTVSALTGSGVTRIFPAVEAVYSQYQRQFPTNRLNLLLQNAVAAHPPPMYRGHRLKLYYTTQIGIKPPTFAVIANYPKGVHFSYHRYLTNQFRKELGLDKSPVKILMRERKRKKYS
jgi:GTP-binding protein